MKKEHRKMKNQFFKEQVENADLYKYRSDKKGILSINVIQESKGKWQLSRFVDSKNIFNTLESKSENNS